MGGTDRGTRDPAERARKPRDPAPDTYGADEPKLQLDAPSIELPRGGGAIRSIDEKFSVNPANGTGSLTLPMPFSPARNGFKPPVQLRYDSGNGNSVAGLGWALDLPSIKRRTDRRLPRYRDDDVILIAGADDLVPSSTWQSGAWHADVATVGTYEVRRYRPRIEGDFARIERITDAALGTWWRATSRDNVTTFFGLDAGSRIVDPTAPEHVYQWLPALSFDDQGNCLVYDYSPEDLKGVDTAPTRSEANRVNGLAPFANLHLKRLRYGNRVPYFVDESAPYRPAAPPGDFVFEAVFDYGEHDLAAPTPTVPPGTAWSLRSDPFSSYRAGFDIRTYRLLERVLMFHRFDELAGGAATLVRSLDLGHQIESALTHLVSATQCGYAQRPDGSYSRKALPPLSFEYEPLQWQTTAQTVEADSIANLPAGVAEGYEWIDLYGEGIRGIFTEQPGAWYYKANLGDVGETGHVRFDVARAVIPKPSLAGFKGGALQLVDRDADGHVELVVHTPELQGFFGRDDDERWLPFRPFQSMVRIDLADHNLRQLDLDGDGRADLLITEENAFVWYRGDESGYQPHERTAKPYDEERGPAVVFAEEQQTIFLADMSGDGLVDIVRIRNGEICYWPNLGYGRFGAKVAMENAPVFAPPDQFDARYVYLADVSGTGASDVLYIGPHGCDAYLNHSGNAWGAAQSIARAFPVESPHQIAVTDLLGNGTACIVWSSVWPAHAGAPMRYIDLMAGKKPHLLRRYSNNLGKEVSFSYKSSTWFYLKDRAEGRPWATRLPFPVHCLRQMEVHDQISGARVVSDYRYHHGYYDRVEREFRGFGMVEQRDAESFESWAKAGGGHVVDASLYQTPVLTKTWFHTGAPADRAEILARFADDYWDREMARQGFSVTATEPALPDARLIVAAGADPSALTPLDPTDWREALRACKGMVLRSELFALDAPAVGATAAQRQKQLSPFTVATHNCVIELLQPAMAGQHAVFVVKESEALSFHYERELEDPRIEHKLNVVVDELGNVVESASVTYGRRTPDPSLPAEAQAAQARPSIIYSWHQFTGDEIADAHYRLRRPSRVSAYELVGLPASGAIYRIDDFANVLTTGAVEIAYHDRDAVPPAGTVNRRLIRRKETVYYDAALRNPLPLHSLHFRALPFESYELAYTAALVADLFGGRATDALMTEGGYVHRGDADWWVPSGRRLYVDEGETIAVALSRFIVPVAQLDPFGARSSIGYFAGYFLLIDRVQDAASNVTRVDAFDLRVLKPTRIVDANVNVTELLYDELGWVKATALRGKGSEADDLTGLDTPSSATDDAARAAFLAAPGSVELDAAARTLLQRATSRFIYDADAFVTSGAPPSSATIVREQHAAVLVESPLQLSFEYANGMGKVELHKVQAEPGPAKQVTLLPGDNYTVTVVDTTPRIRWLGTGRRIFNNKGKPVKEYEPFFSVRHTFETEKELVEAGVTRIFSYDSVDRMVRVDHPDATFSRTEYAAWKVADWDRNDTVLDSAWYTNRVHRLIDAELIADGKDPAREAAAATQAAAHAATPLVRHLDPLGRPVLEIEHNGLDALAHPILLPTRRVRDVEGNLIQVIDARGNVTVSYEHDMRGRVASHASADGGTRWTLDHVMSEPLRAWDERNHEFVFAYDDPLHRATSKRVRGGDGATPLDHVFERTVWGEGRPGDTTHNLRGRVALLYDTAGRIENVDFDFKGNLLASTRRFARDHKAVPDWSGATPDAALATEPFSSSATWDALNRVQHRSTADGSVYEPGYNEANLLDELRITQGGASTVYVSDIDYDEQGRRQKIVFGNGVTTTYEYDRETFRLLHLACGTLQDLHYTYDPVGNVTHLEDRAVPTVWFANQMVTGLSTYQYDPLYRLVAATGREHAAQVDFGTVDNWADVAMRDRYSVGDPLVWRNYSQQYRYDAVGNMTELQHVAGTGSWTRAYSYAAGNNRLASTQVGATVFPYAYHPAHGYLTAIPHLTRMQWSFRDELQATSTQAGATPETTWYVYDGQGKRVRKVTEAAVTAAKKNERFYLDGVEVYREYDGLGATTLERSTLEVMDDRQRVALIETEGATRLVRYQGIDHVWSAHVETDGGGRVISYEEYHPFGTTAYQAVDRDVVAAAKRYRYTGMERDEESGLEYHHHRYYMPWLCRWTAPDQHPEQLDGNRYAYVKNNPTKNRDPNGLFEEPTHGVLTYRLALAAGFSQQDAARIAIATAAMDHDAATSPVSDPAHLATFRIRDTERLHYPSQEVALGDINRDIAGGSSTSLEKFGQHLHSLEDVGFREAPGPHMRSDFPGKPGWRMTQLAGGLGLLLMSTGLILAVNTPRISGTAGQWAAGIGAALLLAVGLYFFLVGIIEGNIGHPGYHTERGELSTSLSHIADRAPSDPRRNTAEMLLVYDRLKALARARGYTGPTDDAGARAAIEQAVSADNACLVSKFANGRPLDVNGVRQPAYTEILSHRNDRGYLGPTWGARDMDVSLWQSGEWRNLYIPSNSQGITTCPAH